MGGMVESLVIPARFNGPPGTANGGYFSGRVAALLGSHVVTVTLRQPPPVDVSLEVVWADDGLRVVQDGVLIAEAAGGALERTPVEAVAYDEAAAAGQFYGGLAEHPFPTCFTCGLARDDGLGLRPGTRPGQDGHTAASWLPVSSLTHGGAIPDAIVWAALDCPGGWTVDLVGRPMVLGRMTGQVLSIPDIDERCVVVGRLDGRNGRKAFSSTTAYAEDGRVLGRAEAVWIEIKR